MKNDYEKYQQESILYRLIKMKDMERYTDEEILERTAKYQRKLMAEILKELR